MANEMRNRIREVRKMKNITQTKLVENISITRQYISLIELGEETPSLKVWEVENKFNIKEDAFWKRYKNV